MGVKINFEFHLGGCVGGLKLLNTYREGQTMRSKITGELGFKSTPNSLNVMSTASNSRTPCDTFGCIGSSREFKPPLPPPSPPPFPIT